MRTLVALAVLVAVGWGGFLLGARTHRAEPAPEPGTTAEIPATATTRASGECQGLKNQLAICMAYQPKVDAAGRDEKDKFLAMCRADLDGCRNKPTFPACWDFIDLAPIYDRELGEADPSPETLERAKKLSDEECAEVLTWAARAGAQQRTCLEGRSPPPQGFRERYGRPIMERPYVRACRRPDAFNAWQKREENRLRESGGEPNVKVRQSEDGGVTLTLPDGRTTGLIAPDAP